MPGFMKLYSDLYNAIERDDNPEVDRFWVIPDFSKVKVEYQQ
jgi:hypothetical protein